MSPFSGASDICPQDDTAWRLLAVSWANTSIELSRENLSRLGSVLLPPAPAVLAKACQQGFEDALRFLQRRYLIACTRCLNVSSTYVVEEEEEEVTVMKRECDDDYRQNDDESMVCNDDDDEDEFEPNCLECSLTRRLAREQQSVPENVRSVFEAAAADPATKTGLLARLPAGGILRLLTLPAALPLSVASCVGSRLLNLVPAAIADDQKLKAAGEQLLEAAMAYVTAGGYLERLRPPQETLPRGRAKRRPHHPQQHHHAKYTCEFNITQYGDEEEEKAEEKKTMEEFDMVDGSGRVLYERQESVKDILVLELTAELESDEAVALPHTQADAIRFQTENLAAAVSSSATHSRTLSRAVSRESSRGPASAMGSRAPSLSSLVSSSDGGSPLSSATRAASITGDSAAVDTIELLRQVSGQQEALMAFYYTDPADNQVRMTEIFDVTTAADPAVLRAAAAAADDFGVDYNADDLLDYRGHHMVADNLAHSQSSPCGLAVGGGGIVVGGDARHQRSLPHRHHSRASDLRRRRSSNLGLSDDATAAASSTHPDSVQSEER